MAPPLFLIFRCVKTYDEQLCGTQEPFLRILKYFSTYTLFLCPLEVYTREDHGNINNKAGVRVWNGWRINGHLSITTAYLIIINFLSQTSELTDHAAKPCSWVCIEEVATCWWRKGEMLGSTNGIWEIHNLYFEISPCCQLFHTRFYLLNL